jgi:hypothetical protein
MTGRVCPFCGDPHPMFADGRVELDPCDPDWDEAEAFPTPECPHWLGRYDSDGGYHTNPEYYSQCEEEMADYSGGLSMLNSLVLPACSDDGADPPSGDALASAFGERLVLAAAVYDSGWDNPGNPEALFDGLADTLDSGDQFQRRQRMDGRLELN